MQPNEALGEAGSAASNLDAEAKYFSTKKKELARRSSVNSLPLFARGLRQLFPTATIGARYNVPQGGHALTLAAGEMRGEYKMFKRLGCSRADAWDISEGQREVFLTSVNDGSISVDYQIADVNYLELEVEKYDVCYMQQSLHHVERLEHLCAQIAGALKPTGIFILSDYIGPKRLRRSARQRAICEPLWEFLPARLRMDRSGRIRRFLHEPHDKAISPYEAIRSDEILGVLDLNFEILEIVVWGGVAYSVTNGFAHNYEKEDERFLRLIWNLDRQSALHELCEPNFVKAILRPKRPI